MRRIRLGCCARTASGHVAAVPPTSVMNSRRFIADPKPKDHRSIAGQGRASQQKRSTLVRYGSISTHAVETRRPCLSASPRKRPSQIKM
jgi:hypothetical protein